MDRSNYTFGQVRKILNFKLDHFGMLVGMPKQSISRLEKEHRKETFSHKETLALLMFIKEKGLLADYIKWRFGIPLTNKYYKKIQK